MTRDALRRAKRVVVVLPVGAGKTCVAAEMIRLALARGKRVLFIVHRIELVRQAVDRLASVGITAGTVTATSQDVREVTVASIQTMHARECYPPADLLFLDECHHARAKTWGEALERYPAAYVIGLTATPFRLDGQGLGDVFHELVIGVRTATLCAEGVLVEPDVYAPPGPDLANVRVRRGDFEERALADAMEKPKLVGDIVEHWQRICSGRRTVAFAASVRHSEMIRDAFLAAGVKAAHVDGKTPREERRAALESLARGDVPVISNCALFGEGTDVPALEVAILARPTASRALHIQMIGRIMRAAEGKGSAVVLDHAGNSHRHGLVTDHIEYSLAGKQKIPVPRIYRCPSCYVVLPGPVDVCPECGFVWPASAAREAAPPTVEGVLAKFTKRDEVETYTALIAEANLSRRRLGWARHQFKERFSKWPRHADLEQAYVCTLPETVKPEYGAERCARCLRAPHGLETPITSEVDPARPWI
jgi:DNA repair protein RadD